MSGGASDPGARPGPAGRGPRLPLVGAAALVVAALVTATTCFVLPAVVVTLVIGPLAAAAVISDKRPGSVAPVIVGATAVLASAVLNMLLWFAHCWELFGY